MVGGQREHRIKHREEFHAIVFPRWYKSWVTKEPVEYVDEIHPYTAEDYHKKNIQRIRCQDKRRPVGRIREMLVPSRLEFRSNLFHFTVRRSELDACVYTTNHMNTCQADDTSTGHRSESMMMYFDASGPCPVSSHCLEASGFEGGF